MILPTIDGRECVPVRLLPFMTNWRPLSSDVVARLFSRHNALHRWSISSFNLSPNGPHYELPPGAWNTIDDDLNVLLPFKVESKNREIVVDGVPCPWWQLVVLPIRTQLE